MGSRFNVLVDCENKREILLEMGWTINKGWTDCPRYIYDELNDDVLADYFSQKEIESRYWVEFIDHDGIQKSIYLYGQSVEQIKAIMDEYKIVVIDNTETDEEAYWA